MTNDIHGYRGKELPEGKWLPEQIKALPTIARLAREGRIIFCTSTELRFERFHASSGMSGLVGDLFRGIDYEQVPPAVERSYFWQTVDVNKYASGKGQAEWYREFLLKVDENQFFNIIDEHMELPDCYRKNFANLRRFREICEPITKNTKAKQDKKDKQIRDAFHLWTAEVNNLDYFLTADEKFINLMTASSKIDLPTPPVAPATLLEKLGISKLDPLPVTDDRFRYWFETD